MGFVCADPTKAQERWEGYGELLLADRKEIWSNSFNYKIKSIK